MTTDLLWGGAYDDGRESPKRLELIRGDIEKTKGRKLPKNTRVLDVGANVGFFSYGLADHGYDVTLVEPPNKKTFDDRVTEHRVWVETGSDLPKGQFDFALVLSVLHHIEEWKDVLDTIVSRTTKAVYVEVPHPEEHHKKWFGSRGAQDEYVKFLGSDSYVIGSHWEVSRRFRRDLWKVNP